MTNSADKFWKYFFICAGIITALGAFPAMLFPKNGLKLTMGLSYADKSPQVEPIIGHWGIMVVGIGILLFASAKYKQLRLSTIIFSTAEKIYLVSFAIYNFIVDASYANNYTIVIIGDGLMALVGIIYLIKYSKRIEK